MRLALVKFQTGLTAWACASAPKDKDGCIIIHISRVVDMIHGVQCLSYISLFGQMDVRRYIVEGDFDQSLLVDRIALNLDPRHVAG